MTSGEERQHLPRFESRTRALKLVRLRMSIARPRIDSRSCPGCDPRPAIGSGCCCCCCGSAELLLVASRKLSDATGKWREAARLARCLVPRRTQSANERDNLLPGGQFGRRLVGRLHSNSSCVTLRQRCVFTRREGGPLEARRPRPTRWTWTKPTSCSLELVGPRLRPSAG